MDIVDGDNAAEIAGEQRGLMMTLLASERASERIERVARGQGLPVYSLAHWPGSSRATPLCLSLPLPLFQHLRRPNWQTTAFRLRRRSVSAHRGVRHPLCIVWHYNHRALSPTPMSILVN